MALPRYLLSNILQEKIMCGTVNAAVCPLGEAAVLPPTHTALGLSTNLRPVLRCSQNCAR